MKPEAKLRILNKGSEIEISGSEQFIREQIAYFKDFIKENFSTKRTKPMDKPHILWVDDRPQNNIGEVKQFQQMGIIITTSTSTEDALEKAKTNQYGLIISDMGRPPDERAGYTLLEELKNMNITIPFIIYSGSNLPEHKAEANQYGAIGSTNNFEELLLFVKSILHIT